MESEAVPVAVCCLFKSCYWLALRSGRRTSHNMVGRVGVAQLGYRVVDPSVWVGGVRSNGGWGVCVWGGGGEGGVCLPRFWNTGNNNNTVQCWNQGELLLQTRGTHQVWRVKCKGKCVCVCVVVTGGINHQTQYV